MIESYRCDRCKLVFNHPTLQLTVDYHNGAPQTVDYCRDCASAYAKFHTALMEEDR